MNGPQPVIERRTHTHAERRVLFNAKVTDFAHVQALFTDAYARLALSTRTPLFSVPQLQ